MKMKDTQMIKRDGRKIVPTNHELMDHKALDK
jgi:hypothetical protein